VSVRVLPPEEWDRLPEDIARFCGTLSQDDVFPLVYEDSGVIVGRVLLMRAPHLEAWWVAPERYGNAGVTRALLRESLGLARSWGAKMVFANAEPGPMCDTLERLSGQWLPVHTFMLPSRLAFTEETCRPEYPRQETMSQHCQSDPITATWLVRPSAEDSLCQQG
jgi:hypothetical protein